jgi:hypothetical protein
VTPARAGTSAVVAVLGAAGLLLVLVTWAASIGPEQVVSGGHVERIEGNRPRLDSSLISQGHGPQLPGHDPADPPAWVGAVAFGLELLTLGVLIFLLGRLLRRAREAWQERRMVRRRPHEPPAQVEFEVLGSAQHVTDVMAEDAEEQRSILELPGEPRNAIVECWHRFEQQAVRAGVPRWAWQTTSEFVLGVLDLVGADPGAVQVLAGLYREARFSDHVMTEDHRRRALEALDAVHRSLRPRVGGLR